MNLTEQEQRQLTEFLGECWHEGRQYKRAGVRSGVDWCCKYCGQYLGHGVIERLDFSDWRVVGRLQQRLPDETTISLYAVCYAIVLPDQRIITSKKLEEAICRAVLAWLGEKK
jgi:hypothetical protein